MKNFFTSLFLVMFTSGCVGYVLRKLDQQEMDDAQKRLEACNYDPDKCTTIIIEPDLTPGQ